MYYVTYYDIHSEAGFYLRFSPSKLSFFNFGWKYLFVKVIVFYSIYQILSRYFIATCDILSQTCTHVDSMNPHPCFQGIKPSTMLSYFPHQFLYLVAIQPITDAPPVNISIFTLISHIFFYKTQKDHSQIFT